MRALFLKEWVKLRPVWGLLLVANGLLMLYLWIDMRHHFRVEHAEMLYYQANRIGRLFYSDMRYAPLLTGLLLALAQFWPEVTKGRLRLSLHLPVGLATLTLTYLTIGLGGLAVLLLLEALALYGIIALYFPIEFANSALVTASAWILAGFVAYLGVTMIVLEPGRGRKLFYSVIVGGLVWLCHLAQHYGQAAPLLPGLIALTLLLIPAVFLPVFRFRYGGRS